MNLVLANIRLEDKKETYGLYTRDRNKRSIVRKRDDKKMKARVLRDYPDKITNRWYKKDEIVNFDDVRIKELIEKGLVEIYKEPKQKQETPETSD